MNEREDGHKPLPQYDESTDIYLLVSKMSMSPRGFMDRGNLRSFTFAFTTTSRAEAFLRKSRAIGLLTDVDRLCPVTIGEYFERMLKGKTQPQLAIDPDPDMLDHPIMQTALHDLN
jgi:hypothetical protein